MILVQLSSGAGPLECCKAVAMAVKRLECDAKALAIKVNALAVEQAELSGCYKSVLLELTGAEPRILKQFAQQWHGSMLWVCQSPFRARHKRKNWYFGGQLFEIAEQTFDSEIRFQQCRASGAGGQHVNTTDSAVRATHVATGTIVRVESERSQHANKRLARVLLMQKLAEQAQQAASQQQKSRWQQHNELQRGNPIRTFKGPEFSQTHKGKGYGKLTVYM